MSEELDRPAAEASSEAAPPLETPKVEPTIPPETPAALGPAVPDSESAAGRNWAAVAHLSAFLGYASVPLFVIGPLIIWAALKDKHPFVDDQAKEAINFQLSVLLYTLAAIPMICLCVGIVLLVLISLMNFVFVIVAAIRASSGERYRYPLAIRFLK